ncbi:MAG: FHA domain-containing protein [Candidatus Obscuribacterales bacterium]|nr:FHA domain-containing protein [Candidatus Obscuribacterales bacterium]
MTSGLCARCGGVVDGSGRCTVCGNPAGAPQQIQPGQQQGKPMAPSRPAFLYNKLTNERFPLTQSVSKIGRDQTNNISITNDHYISRHHSWVLQMQGGYWIEDLGSTNGTLVNGELLGERRQINPGDRLTIGKTELIFVME